MTPQTIRLCTWNIQLGLQLERIKFAIKTQDDLRSLDLLALQEASIRSNREDAQEIAAELGPEYESYQVTAHFLGKRAQANALVWNSSRVRITTKDSIKLPRAREVKMSRTERTILYVLRQQERISIVLDGMIGDESLRVYIAHLDVLGLKHKWEQFNHILVDASIRQPPADFSILVGDLNTFRIRSRPSWTRMEAAAKSAGFEDLTTEIRWTHILRHVRMRQKLDAIFVQRARPIKYRSWSLDIPGSDHIPVFADITLL